MASFLDGRREHGGGSVVKGTLPVWYCCRLTHLTPTQTPTSDAGLPSLISPAAAAAVVVGQTATGQRSVYICSRSTIMRQDDLITLIRDEN